MRMMCRNELCLSVAFMFLFQASAWANETHEPENLKIIDNVSIGEEVYSLLKKSDGNQFIGRNLDKNSECLSNDLPPNSSYIRGETYLSFTKTDKNILNIQHEAFSGNSSRYYDFSIDEKSCNYYVSSLIKRYGTSKGIYVENYDFLNRKYEISYKGSLLSKGSVLVANEDYHNDDSVVKFDSFMATYGNRNIKSSLDLSAKIEVLWKKDYLHVKLFVRDDYLNFGRGIHKDHIEVWLAEETYQGRPFKSRKDKDSKVKQYLINIVDNKPLLTYGFPEKPGYESELEGNIKEVKEGYEIDFKLMYSDMLSEREFDYVENNVKQFVDGDLLNMTFVISDSDKRGKQESMIATSKLKYGNPSTFGKLLLLKRQLPELSKVLIN